MYGEFEIRQIPLSISTERKRIERFLQENALQLEDVDYYAGIFRNDDNEIIAGGGLKRDIIKCIAVSPESRSEALSNSLVSHLISVANNRGFQNIKVFTKPENKEIFESFGFKLLASSAKAVLMENGNGLQNTCRTLQQFPRQGKTGIIVMNANPFTIGHRYLVEQAAKQVETLFVMVVKEDVSAFSFTERLQMVTDGVKDIGNVTVIEGSDYIISASTFPTYFLKKRDDASTAQIQLDLDLFVRYIAPSLHVCVRFVGSEPKDMLTRDYNDAMKQILPRNGVEVVEIERKQQNGRVVSASDVRNLLNNGALSAATSLVSPITLPYLLSYMATKSLLDELNTTPKPGLVDQHDSGAHQDMDYALMCRSITALHPYFTRLSQLGFQNALPGIHEVTTIGKEAEAAMLDVTHGINTHRGAIFSLGLSLVAVAHCYYHSLYYNRSMGENNNKAGEQHDKVSEQHNKVGEQHDRSWMYDNISRTIAELARHIQPQTATHGGRAVSKYKIGGALANAQTGYAKLFTNWLPFYHSIQTEACANHKLLLRIITTIDDTNVYYRHDAETFAWLRHQAEDILQDFSVEKLEALNKTCTQRHISPGGSADMLALTLFLNSI